MAQLGRPQRLLIMGSTPIPINVWRLGVPGSAAAAAQPFSSPPVFLGGTHSWHSSTTLHPPTAAQPAAAVDVAHAAAPHPEPPTDCALPTRNTHDANDADVANMNDPLNGDHPSALALV